MKMFDAVAAMAAAHLKDGQIVETKGYYAAGDGGQGKYLIKTAAQFGGTPDEFGDHTLANGNVAVLQNAGSVSLTQYGAVSDGSVDSAAAIQAAFDSGIEIRQHTGTFRFDSTLIMPAGLRLYMTGGATFKKNFAGTGLQNTNRDTPANTDDGYILEGLRVRQTNATDRGNVVELINVSNVVIHKIDIVQIATFAAQGAWSLYVSGDNISITEPYIDSTAGTVFADGIHVAYANNLNISDGIILSGDDSIALFPPNQAFSNSGKDQPGGNITISNMILGSTNANLIRIGASGSATEGSDALQNVVYDGIRISNIIDATPNKTAGQIIRISDTRAPGAITGQHTNIVIDGVSIKKVVSDGVIRILGNPDVTDIANIAQNNFGRITLTNINCNNNANGQTIYGGGAVSLAISDCIFSRTLVATVGALDLYTIQFVTLRDVLLVVGSAGTTGTGARIRYVKQVELYNTKIQSGGEFRTLTIDSNAVDDTVVRLYGGAILGAARGVDNLEGTGYTELVVSGMLIDASVSDITAAALNAASATVEKVGEFATSDGTTGGAASAGAGNQYVELVIGGVTYKVLHDGTV